MGVPPYSFLFFFSNQYVPITTRTQATPTETYIDRSTTTYSTVIKKKRNTPIIKNQITDLSALSAFASSIYYYHNGLNISIPLGKQKNNSFFKFDLSRYQHGHTGSVFAEVFPVCSPYAYLRIAKKFSLIHLTIQHSH